MHANIDLDRLIRERERREVLHSAAYGCVAESSNQILAARVRDACAASRLREQRWEVAGTAEAGMTTREEHDLAKVKQLREEAALHEEKRLPAHPKDSALALLSALQPVRDHVTFGNWTFGPDRTLDVFSTPYGEVWTDSEGNVPDYYHTVFAVAETGSIGFYGSNPIGGRSDGEGDWAYSGAAIWIPFVPPASAAAAQVRPYLPYGYKFLTSALRAPAFSRGGFGVLVLSWDASGQNRLTELDVGYDFWNFSSLVEFDDHSNPSYYIPAPGWDYDTAFPDKPPYFKVSTGRIYKAAVWCFGNIRGYRSSSAIGAIDSAVRLVVIGYQ